MKALIADDSFFLRAHLANTLRDLGLDADAVKDGVQVLEYLEHNGMPDVLFLDWNMPKMNGLEVISHVRKDSRFAKLPIIMVTAESDVEMVSWALELGADDCLVKPLTPDLVADKLFQWELSKGMEKQVVNQPYMAMAV